MKASPSRLAIDASVIIDLQRGGIINLLFELPYQFVTPDVIIAELGEPDGTDLENFGLIGAEFTGAEVFEVMELMKYHPQTSAPDLFALILAVRERVTLLTGDGSLRKLAAKHRVPVHGTLWVLDELLSHDLLTKGQAAHALRKILLESARLPSDECEKRLKEWELR